MTKPEFSDNPDAGEYFDALAKDYEPITQEHGWPARQAQLVKRIFDSKPAEEVGHVLDLGAGNGHTVEAILRHAKPEQIVAVDASAKMLELFRDRHQDPTIKTLRAPIEAYVPVCKGEFDLVTALGVLEFVTELPEVVSQIGKLLNEQGVFAATYIPSHETAARSHVMDSEFVGRSLKEYAWPRSDIEAALIRAGLDICQSSTLEAYQRDGQEGVFYNFFIAEKS